MPTSPPCTAGSHLKYNKTVACYWSQCENNTSHSSYSLEVSAERAEESQATASVFQLLIHGFPVLVWKQGGHHAENNFTLRSNELKSQSELGVTPQAPLEAHTHLMHCQLSWK